MSAIENVAMKMKITFLLFCLGFMPFVLRSQIINTIAGTGAASFTGDGGAATSATFNSPTHVVVDAAGNIFVNDYQNNRIRKINTSGVISTFAGTGVAGYTGDGGAATAARLSHPNVISIDAFDNIYFGDQGNNVIRKITPAGVITTVAGNGTYGYSGDGGQATAARLSNVVGCGVDASGNIYVSDYSNHRIRKVNSAGIITTVAGTGVAGFSGDGGAATAAKIYQPTGVTFDAGGNYYIVDQLNNRIRKVTPAGIISTVAGSSSAVGYSGDGGAATAALMHYPAEIAIDAAGNFYITDQYNSTIRKVSTTGIMSSFAGNGVAGFAGDGGAVSTARFNQCTGVHIDVAGNLYVSDFYNNRVRKIVFGNTQPAFMGGVSQSLTVCQNSSPVSINSLLAVNDPDVGQTETWSSVLAPIHGVAAVAYITTSTGTTLTPTGLSYTPTTGYVGSDSFKVMVADGVGSDTITIYVIVNPLPDAGTVNGPGIVCVGSTVTLNSVAAGGVWSSSNVSVATVGGATGIVGGVSSGTAIISYSVTNICGTSVDTQAVTVISLPVASITSLLTSVCLGTTITLTSSPSGGTWTSSSPSVATVGASTGVVGGVSTGTTIISYTAANACGTSTDTQSIAVTTVPGAGVISGPTSVCVGTTAAFSNPLTGGTWSSSNSAIATVNAASGMAGGVSAGNVIISYTLTSACGTGVDTQMVTVSPAPNAGNIIGSSGTCEGATLTLTNAVAGGMWSSGIPAIATVSAAGVVSGVLVGTTVISYTVTNSCGTATDTILITVHPLPDAAITAAFSLSPCIGASITLTAATPGGVWNSSNPSIATVNNSTGVASAVTTGSTTITYVTPPSVFGCVDTATMPITILPQGSLVVNSVVQEIACTGEANGGISLSVPTGTGTYQYAWSTGATSSSIAGLATGSYSVVVIDLGTNCRDTLLYNLTMPASLEIKTTIVNDYCSSGNGSIDLVDVIGGVASFTYLWSTGATTTNIAHLTPATYTVVITDKNLCAQQFSIVVGEDSCNTIDIHDVITPNGDGINDVWVIEGIHRHPNNSVALFDKWGDAVFSAAPYRNDWDGGTLPDGTYFYLIKLDSKDNTEGGNIFKGQFLIKR